VALVAAPSSGASLSSLVHLIWCRTDGDINFQSITLITLYSSMLFDRSNARTETKMWAHFFWLITIGWNSTRPCFILSFGCFVIRLQLTVGFKRYVVIRRSIRYFRIIAKDLVHYYGVRHASCSVSIDQSFAVSCVASFIHGSYSKVVESWCW